MRVRVVMRSRSRPGGRPDDDDLQVAPLLEGVEPGRIAVTKCLNYRFEEFQPWVFFSPDAFQVYFE